MLPACGDGGPAGPRGTPPSLSSVLPTSASAFDSPTEMTLTGKNLGAVTVQGPPWVFLEVTEQAETRVRLKVGFAGGPPGQAWIRAANPWGADSIPFIVEPVAAGDSLTETRALWVSRFEYASAAEVAEVMEKAGEGGFNLVFFQVRGRADAFYQSAHEPWAHNLTGTLGQDPGWDPLGTAVEEGARQGLEVHAWINAFTGWAGTTPPPVSDPLHAFLEHPDWVMVDQNGLPMPYQSGSRWMSPGHPGVRTRLARVASDIAENYDVAGVHLDFIRYPGGGEYSYDEPSLLAFDSARVREPGLSFEEMRRRFVTQAVMETHDSLAVADSEAELSAAVWGIFKNELGWSGVSTGYASIFQDARRWDRLGIVDALAPMVYWTITTTYGDPLDFAYLADDHARGIDRPVFIGMNVHDLDGRSLAQQVERARMAGAEGVSVFSYSGLEAGDLWDALRSWAFFLPARKVE